MTTPSLTALFGTHDPDVIGPLEREAHVERLSKGAKIALVVVGCIEQMSAPSKLIAARKLRRRSPGSWEQNSTARRGSTFGSGAARR